MKFENVSRVLKLIQAKMPFGVSGLGAHKPTLVKWFILNAASVVFLGTLAKFYGGNLRGAPLVGAIVIAAIFICGSLQGARLCSAVDDPFARSKDVLHRASFLPFWAWLCQMAGILATLAGLEILLTGTHGTLHDRLLSGGGIVFISTFVGVFTSVVLTAIHRIIEHELEG